MLVRLLTSGLMLVAISAASTARADDEGARSQNQSQAPKVTLDDLKAKCRELSADPQRKPISAKITCSDLSNRWDQAQQGSTKLPNSRKVGAQIDLKGITMAPQFFDRPVQDFDIVCPQFVKIDKVVDSVEADIACDDLVKMDNLSDFCANLVDQRLTMDAGIVKEIRTKEIKSLCPN